MGNAFYCYQCDAFIETTIIEKEQTLNVKGVEITLRAPVRICAVCGKEVLDEEIDDKTLALFYNEYRKLQNLLLPEEIKEIRTKYGLSQSSFARLLGFGEKTITRYENGAIQDVCHDNLIRLMTSIDAFIRIWNERKACLATKEQARIDTIVKTYNKTKIQSTYNTGTPYRSCVPTLYVINRGDRAYAG